MVSLRRRSAGSYLHRPRYLISLIARYSCGAPCLRSSLARNDDRGRGMQPSFIAVVGIFGANLLLATLQQISYGIIFVAVAWR